MNVVIGILLLAAGLILVIKSDWFLNNFGRIAWFEKILGTSGGSRLGYKLLGMIFILIGIIFITGSGDGFMTWLVAPVTKYN